MATRVLTNPEDFKAYDRWIKNHPHGSLWQSLEWKTYQESLGREIRIYVMEDSSVCAPYPPPLHPPPQGGVPHKDKEAIMASAFVVIDRTILGLSTWNIPRGPLTKKSEIRNSKFEITLFKTIVNDAKKDKCISLYLSPPTPLQTTPVVALRALRGATRYSLQTSQRHEQPEATRIIDLTQSDEAILSHMKPKGRYNIRVAEKNGVEVRRSQDIDAFYELLKDTSRRDGFKTLPKAHYKAFLEQLPGSFLLMAYVPQFPLPRDPPSLPSPSRGRYPAGGVPSLPIAGLMGVIWPPNNKRNYGEGLGLVGPKPGAIPNGEEGARGGETGGFPPTIGIYYYGASNYAYRATMAPYLLQWEGMKRCKEKGCQRYDLLGIVKSEPLPLTPSPREGGHEHPWAGVSKFKEQFGGSVIEYPPEQEIVLKPLIKKILTLKRRFF